MQPYGRILGVDEVKRNMDIVPLPIVILVAIVLVLLLYISIYKLLKI